MNRILFFGTPAIAVPFLDFLADHYTIAGVVTRKDKPAARHQQVLPSAVKVAAVEKGIPVFSPESLQDSIFLEQIKNLGASMGIVVAYGRLIPPALINCFDRGLYNVHFSLLPQYRGAAPMQWTLLNGESQSGVTIFKIEQGLDSGPIVCQKKMPVSAEENFFSLQEKLVALGIASLKEVIDPILAGTVIEQAQTGQSSLAPVLQKSDAQIDWDLPAQQIDRKVRALIYMGAFCNLSDGKKLKILQTRLCDPSDLPTTSLTETSPGQVCMLIKNQGFVVRCQKDYLSVLEVQPEGKKPMSAWSFLQGHPLLGSVLL